MSDGQIEFIEWQLGPEGQGLGRHIRHDPRSREHPAPRRAVPLTDVFHRNWGRRLDQDGIGACTAFTAAHCLNHMPNRVLRRPKPTFRRDDAFAWYGGATKHDPWPGEYPPDDTGSSGLAVCQELVERALIAGYEWGFGFDHGVEGIAASPWMQGTWWTEDMFTPERDGRVRPSGRDAGGHEYLWVGVDVRRKRSWFLNSWSGWGVTRTGQSGGQFFYMTWDDHRALLERDGDLVRPKAV